MESNVFMIVLFSVAAVNVKLFVKSMLTIVIAIFVINIRVVYNFSIMKIKILVKVKKFI